jgi:NDP-sugar pyrophosphorylase family protein
MGALTEHTPKPMILLHGRPMLEYVIESLPPHCDDVIIVVNYHQEKIREHFGGEHKGKRIRYVEQQELNGTGGALWDAQALLTGAFLVVNGDDVCLPQDVAACASSPDWAVLVQEVSELGSAAQVVLDAQGLVVDILEKEKHSGGPGLANTANFFLLDTRIFSYDLVLRPGSDSEYGLPQTVVQAAGDIPLHPIYAGAIIRLTAPEDIALAEAQLSQKKAK